MKLVGDFVKFERDTNRIISNLLKRIYDSNLKKAEQEVKELVKLQLYNSSTAKSIDAQDTESLAGHFGIPYGEETESLEAIINTIAEYVKVTFSHFPPSGGKLRTTINIVLGDEVYPELQTLDEGQVLTEKGEVIYWLEWLLLGGKGILISEFDVEFELGKGRSGQAIMIPGTGWQIPAEHAGTRQDNWLTRTLREDDFLNEIASTTFRILNR